MNKQFFILMTSSLCLICNLFGQSAEELNKQAKDFLTKGDTKSAVPLLRKAAEMGQPESQYNYGYCFQQGIEVEKNDSIANIWLLKSAKQDWIDAQFKIAYSYAIGRGCEKDMKQAFYWSVKCAEQDDPECMFNVVNCYLEGVGTGKNIDSMLAWAVRLGSHQDLENLQLSGMITSARANLATMYRDGNNVKKDLVKSYMWFLIYNESKRDFSIPDQQNNIDATKEVENNLSKGDKDKAKSEAEKQIARKLKNLDNLYKLDTE
jgi:TPR repeat protein